MTKYAIGFTWTQQRPPAQDLRIRGNLAEPIAFGIILGDPIGETSPMISYPPEKDLEEVSGQGQPC